jgi:uncharacterized membrane protein
MTPLDGFANVHPFLVHAPVVLIPTAAIMVLVGRKVRKEGFDTATFLLTVAAAAGTVAALASGLSTDGTFPHDPHVGELIKKHEYNGIALTVITSVAALLAIAEWRRLVRIRLWWLRAALLTWASIGAMTAAHSGATLVYQHGAAVTPIAQPTALAR